MTGPVLASTRQELAELLSPVSAPRGRVGLVPTMGALHEGHASLMSRMRDEVGPDGRVVVSVFVNPLQFGPGEDLARYPRTLDADLAMCREQGVDLVFVPDAAEVYPGGDPQVTVDPGPLGHVLEGRIRPGHYRGVLTVVAKLVGLVQPDVAVFGEKDYQQLVLIRRMVADLCLPVEVVGAATRREPDGLAMSSRNRYLDPEQRLRAVAVSRTLYAARAAARWGHDVALEAARAEQRQAHGVDLDYLVITDPDLGDLPGDVPDGTPARALIAARVGGTRLIDNLALTLGGDR
jgi:pantoate--beta-alanine ligase